MKKFVIIGIMFMLGLIGVMAEAESFGTTFLLKLAGVFMMCGSAILWKVWKMDDEMDCPRPGGY